MLVLAVPAFPDLGLELRSLGRLEVWIQEDFKLRVSLGALAIRLPRAALHAVEADPDGGWQAVPAPDDVVRVTLAAGDPGGSVTEHPFTLTIDRLGRIDLEYPFADEATSTSRARSALPAMIGDTGVVIEVDRLACRSTRRPRRSSSTRARSTSPRTSRAPRHSRSPTPASGGSGFSGTVAATWPLELDDASRAVRLPGRRDRDRGPALRAHRAASARSRVTVEDEPPHRRGAGRRPRRPLLRRAGGHPPGHRADGSFVVTLLGATRTACTLIRRRSCSRSTSGP